MVSALEWLKSTSTGSTKVERSKFSEQPVSLGIWVEGTLTPNWLLGEKELHEFTKGNEVRYLPAIPLLKYGNQLKSSQKRVAPRTSSDIDMSCVR